MIVSVVGISFELFSVSLIFGKAQTFYCCYYNYNNNNYYYYCYILCTSVSEIEESGTGLKSADGEVLVNSLRDSLVRFNLHGEKTGEVLCRVLHPVDTDAAAGNISGLTLPTLQVSLFSYSAVWLY